LGKFSKWTTLLYFVVVGLIAMVSLYALYTKRGISASWKDKKIKIERGGEERIVELETTIERMKTDYISRTQYDDFLRKYKDITEEFRKYREGAIEISELPHELGQGSREEVLPRIRLLWASKIELNGDIGYSRRVIEREVNLNLTINTRRPANDQRTVDLYKHIQRLLSAIGFYNGEINGDQGLTYQAVMEFQAANNLHVDGILGEMTWSKIKEKLDEKK